MADETIRREEANGIHHLVMNDGPNALRPPLMEALTVALAELRAAGGPPVLLRSSHDRLFCPGWDLKHLAGADHETVADVLQRFNRLILELFSYPGPTGAAIGGHAVAGGCLLALCCDLRIMVVGLPRIGLSELALGVPVPASSIVMLRQRLAPNVVEELVLGGDGCGAERARGLGVVDRMADVESVVAKTGREIARLAAKSRRAFAETKRFLFRDAWAQMAADSADDDRVFLDSWFAPETQDRITATVERLGS
jgi:enoyl-CoA hydratase